MSWFWDDYNIRNSEDGEYTPSRRERWERNHPKEGNMQECKHGVETNSCEVCTLTKERDELRYKVGSLTDLVADLKEKITGLEYQLNELKGNDTNPYHLE